MRRSRCLAAGAVLIVVACSAGRVVAQQELALERPVEPSAAAVTDAVAAVEGKSIVQLGLCDCKFAQATPGDDGGSAQDLSCAGEGFFIAGFERAGVFSGYQSEGFPLSSAICCRPCFGSSPDAVDAAKEVAAVISVSCQQSTYQHGAQSCPQDTFLQGYPNSEEGQPISKFYPLGQATCCRPALLYKNGSQRLLHRCESVPGACGPSTGGSQVSCDARDDPAAVQDLGRLIYGFSGVMQAPGFGVGNNYIPLAPARCCGVCLDTSEPALGRPCEAANFCNARGQCTPTGRCACNTGWTGSDCLTQDPGGYLSTVMSLPVIVVLGLILAVCFMGCCVRIMQLQRMVLRLASIAQRNAALLARGGAAEEEPLLGSDDDSDDYSEDLSDEEEGGEAGGAVAGAGARWRYQQLPAGGEATADMEAGEREAGEAAGEDGAAPAEDGATEGAAGEGERGAEDGAGGGGGAAGEEKEEGEEAAAPPPRQPRQREPLRNECSVCMSARLQVVFLPCGHACTCRACGRRLRRCPICRTPIVRRQKLYIGG